MEFWQALQSTIVSVRENVRETEVFLVISRAIQTVSMIFFYLSSPLYV